MAYQTGTATSHTDLLSKIIAFAVSGGGWTNLGTAAGQSSGAWLRGPGLSGSEQIFAGLQVYADPDNDAYGITLRGSQGFLADNSFDNQPGVSPAVHSPAWQTSMTYWIVANGQRVIAIWKVSGTYHAIHFGKILPYATPSEYGYPLYIGGEDDTPRRWSYQNQNFRHFTDPGNLSAWLCFPDGSWQNFKNYIDSGGGEFVSFDGRNIWPYVGATTENGGAQTHSITQSLRENLGSTYTLLPLILHSMQPSRATWGEIDGAYYVTGAGTAAEDLITISGQDYLVVQNIYRNSRHHYWALKLA